MAHAQYSAIISFTTKAAPLGALTMVWAVNPFGANVGVVPVFDALGDQHKVNPTDRLVSAG